jgi:hypothetical protein
MGIALPVMTTERDTPTEPTDRGEEPVPDGPKEVEDAASQEAEYPEDETNEG